MNNLLAILIVTTQIKKFSIISSPITLYYLLILDFVPFWDEMSLIDNNCWILEPIRPTKTDFYRRINLNVNNVSMNIKVDPRNPREIPGW